MRFCGEGYGLNTINSSTVCSLPVYTVALSLISNRQKHSKRRRLPCLCTIKHWILPVIRRKVALLTTSSTMPLYTLAPVWLQLRTDSAPFYVLLRKLVRHRKLVLLPRSNPVGRLRHRKLAATAGLQKTHPPPPPGLLDWPLLFLHWLLPELCGA